MKKLFVTWIALTATLASQAETFTIDTAHADVGFEVRHLMVSKVKGSFTEFEGSLDYDIESGALKSAQGTIKAASVDTNNQRRDDHLRNEDFFHVSEYPEIRFESTSVSKTGDNTFEVTGTLYIMGQTKELTFPVTINGPVDGRRGSKVIGIESEFTLNRQELGITHSPSTVISDEVTVELAMEAKH